jgi:transposase
MAASAGIDWASEVHAVCVVDEQGRPLARGTVRHDDAGLARLIDLFRRHDVQRVAMERPDGVLAERLLAAGLPLLAIHPNQVQAARERYRAAAGKSDAFDAFVLAELARTDHHRFRLVVPDHDQTRALQAMTRAREDLVGLKVDVANRLRAELERSWPGAAGLFVELASPIALAFLERYPAAGDAERLGPKRLAGFLARHHYSGRKTPHELLQRLASAPSVQLSEHEAEARRSIVLGLVAVLRPLITQIAAFDRDIAHSLNQHPDGQLYRACFASASTLTAAQLIAEIGDCRDRYPTAESLIADAGQSPVAVESGKRKQAAFRHACDKRLRRATNVLADSSRHHNPWAADIYQRARQRGCNHPHAIRILGRAWLRILWRCWHDHTPYDPTRHGALQRLLTNTG